MKKIEGYTAHVQSGNILLNANESSENLPAEILKGLQKLVLTEAFNRYPSNEEALYEAYANYIGVKKEQVLAGNGSDQMLGYLIGTYLGKGRKLLTLNPDFSMYDYYAQSYEAEIVKYDTNEDGTFDIAAFNAYAKETGADMILFSNPNNPSGKCLNPDEVKEILEANANIPVVMDEAYIEFASQPSSIALVDEYANLFVTRTLSKAYALAGLRVGFLVSNTEVMKKLKAAFVPYALNSVSASFAAYVIKNCGFVKERVKKILAQREEMYVFTQTLTTLSFDNSEANFLRGRCANKEMLLKLFEDAGITIRNYQDNSFRITIGLEEENKLVKEVLQAYEEEEK